MLKKSIGWFSKARGKRQEARGRVLMIEQSMNLHFYLNLIASNPYLVKLSVSQQQALTKFPPFKGGLGGIDCN
ncbi:hypothetical protein [Dactylococcopsis salina]|uniref:hypothetical protein n=1 Tax=Dactylococcopsis salina TaxID=292566 RepID=UPI0002FF13E2|nr:hypothetical protein [Dactylococcopsis salina]